MTCLPEGVRLFLLVLIASLEGSNNSGVGQGSGVTKHLSIGDVSQQATHDLTTAGLG